MSEFDAEQYWEDRLSREYDLQGVGRRNLGIYFNRWAYRARRRAFLRMLQSLQLDFRSFDVLDVGTGTGFYIDCWRELHVRSISGLDLTSVAVRGLEKRYPDCTFHKLDFTGSIAELRGQRFDFVSCMDVLFHIVGDLRYRRAVENVYNLLRPGGLFVFTEAFLCDEARRLKHVVHRSSAEIERLLVAAGFQLVRRQPFLALMNDPVRSGAPLLRAYWHLLRRVVERVHFAGAVAGAML
ncbi:MAG: class I SAM-dependent DNA methyltransferase, partial [Planctomycetota bacterium]